MIEQLLQPRFQYLDGSLPNGFTHIDTRDHHAKRFARRDQGFGQNRGSAILFQERFHLVEGWNQSETDFLPLLFG